MKLKKIASLMLAGIMAVSMLAGCNGSPVNEDPNSEPTTTAGHSATLEENLGKEVTDKKYVSFQDNAQDEAALRQALNNLNTTAALRNSVGKNLDCIHDYALNGFPELIADFTDGAEFTDADLKIGDLAMTWYASNNFINRKVKDGTVFVIDGAVGVDEAVKKVADEVEQYLANLPEHNDNNNNNNDRYDYSYVVSVSVVNKAVDVVDWSNASANFIAVTVTRTATAD